jgi:hypothetical protein
VEQVRRCIPLGKAPFVLRNATKPGYLGGEARRILIKTRWDLGPRGWRAGRGDHDPPSTPLRASRGKGFGPFHHSFHQADELRFRPPQYPQAAADGKPKTQEVEQFNATSPMLFLTLRTESAAAPVGAHRCYARGMVRAEKKYRTRIYRIADPGGWWHTKQGRSQ